MRRNSDLGKWGTADVVLIYAQVTADLTNRQTFEWDMKPPYAIRDNYPKIVLTLDRFTVGDYDGIQVVNVLDWLLEEQ